MQEKHFGPIWFIPGENNGNPPYCNSIYIQGPGILIDPASDRKRLLELKRNPGIKAVWLSHWHEDHIAYLDLFDDVPLLISEQDALPLSSIDEFFNAYGINPHDRGKWCAMIFDNFSFCPKQPDQFLPVGSSVTLGSIRITLLATPGHTPGSTTFYFPDQGVLFMADYDLTPFGPWYGDVASSIEKTIASIEMLRKIPASIWITSHKRGVYETPPGALWDRYIETIHQREAKLLTLLEKPCTIHDIVDAWIAYQKPREPRMFYTFAEKALMDKHLEQLINKGAVALENGKYVITG